MAVITRTMMSGYFFDTSETNKMCSCTRELIHQPNIAETTESHLNQKEIHEIGRSRLNRSTQTNRPRKLICYKSQLSYLVKCDPVFLSFLTFLISRCSISFLLYIFLFPWRQKRDDYITNEIYERVLLILNNKGEKSASKNSFRATTFSADKFNIRKSYWTKAFRNCIIITYRASSKKKMCN